MSKSAFTNYIIKDQGLNELDQHFHLSNNTNLEKEVEEIVDCFWKNTDKYEKLFKPLLISHLNLNWIRRLYIHYFSIKNLSEQHNQIIVKDTNFFIELLKDEFNLILSDDRKDHSERFYINKMLYWLKTDKIGFLKKVYFKYKYFLEMRKKINIIYLDAGKLKHDFNKIENAFNAKFIHFKVINKNKEEAKKIENQIIKNLSNIKLSIPNKILIEFLREKIFNLLPELLSFIESLVKTIKEKKIKIAIISTPSHDHHISLFIASIICNIPCILLGHGFSATKNIHLENFSFYNCRTTNFDYKYLNALDFLFKPGWINDKKI